ncbi:protein FAM161A [Biomphalaria glabrata]|nr:FAM161A-like protein [Biomphalaria glabrata]KAI8784547.1 protein FAM161A [Biomphalaria glabrata]
MATMASTSHRLSAFTSTCIKAPLNPKTGLSSTLHDRKTTVSFNFDDFSNEIDKAKLLNSRSFTDMMINGSLLGEQQNENLVDGNHSDWRQSIPSKEEEFYIRLQQLKEENKKTLDAYTKLYQEKIITEGIHNSQSFDFQIDKSGVDRDVDNAFFSVSNANVVTSPVTKVTKSKPPTGKSKVAGSDNPILSKTLPQKSITNVKKQRPNSAPHMRHSQSLDDNDWKNIFDRPNELKYDENFIISTETDQGLEKIKKLWEDFKISDYPERRHSFSSPRHKDNSNKKKVWRHRITIPQPFTMSLREALKEKKKTKAQQELEERRLEKQKQEEAECEKKFKAQPVPSHVYLPKYEEIMEKNESRRQYVKQYCKELLESQVKPFHFETREKEKKMQRAQSAPVKRTQVFKTTFKAKPVPKHIFSPEIDEKFLEEEELRKIRVRMRAKELLHEAALPPSMAEREKLKEIEKQEKAKQIKMAAKKKSVRYAHNIPDYDALYKDFQKELSRRKATKEGTVVEPFNFETERVHLHQAKNINEIDQDERNSKENHFPHQISRTTPRSALKYLGALSNSLDSIPALSSKAADLRTIRAKKEQERINHRLAEEEEAEKRRKARESKLRQYLKEKTNANDIPNPRDSIAERLKKKRHEDRIRQETYQREIEEMKHKIEQSPLLVEKYMAEKAKKDAENKFSKVLKSAGLNDRQLSSFREPSSPGHNLDASFNDTDRDFGYTNQSDITYTKVTSDEE